MIPNKLVEGKPRKKRVNEELLGTPDWLSVPAAAHRASMCKATFYNALINTGVVKSCLIKIPGNVKGLRRVSRVSLDSYLNRLSETQAAS